MNGSARAAFAGLAALVLLVAGCTGVPDSSKPQVIKNIGAATGPSAALETPIPGADARAIVRGFLDNNASDEKDHATARKFLTSDASARWSDTALTTVLDSTAQISTMNAANDTITVSGRPVATINQSGAYTPTTNTDMQYTFGMKQVRGQWRIGTLPTGAGLLISASQFSLAYTEQTIYFYDAAGQRLVPDPRYSSLTDPQDLASWLLDQVVTQTPPTLTSALPQLANPALATVTLGSTVSVALPGANQLDRATRDKMAGQIALTLDQAVSGTPITITDGGQPVTIPRAGGTRFTAAMFANLKSTGNPGQMLYYVNSQGGVSTAEGNVALPGGLGTGRPYPLNSVALAQAPTGPELLVAGVSGPEGEERLLVGSSDRALAPIRMPRGALSRPTWVPKSDEVWVGNGTKLYRVDAAGTAHAVPINPAAGTPVPAAIVAVRFSPEGARLALVLRSGGESRLWLGTVNRASATVTVTLDAPISPPSITIVDAAWNDELKLFAVGHDSANTPGVYEVQCDGSLWTPSSIGGLPSKPDSITVAENVVAAVSAGGSPGGTVWIQHGGGWVSPNATLTNGTAPIYLE